MSVSETAKQKFGVVAIVGAPNAGKSTFINSIIGEKISIVSSKIQTTRTRVRGVSIQGDTQIVFIDTPGIFKPNKKNNLERAIVYAAWESIEDVDQIIFLYDASKKINDETKALLERLAQQKNTPIILALNKIDKIDKARLLDLSKELNDLMDFDASFMISALKNDGISRVLEYLEKTLPEGPWHYPEDEISDMPMRLLSAEITREKIFESLYQELPYNITVETDAWENFDNGDIKISQTVYTSRDAHKKIILGKGGSNLKKIGMNARQDIEKILNQKTHLKLFVKVQENWMDNEDRFSLWGLSSKH
ncbi:MAG: GTPase Era [Pseudomonadota bacterium]